MVGYKKANEMTVVHPIKPKLLVTFGLKPHFIESIGSIDTQFLTMSELHVKNVTLQDKSDILPMF